MATASQKQSKQVVSLLLNPEGPATVEEIAAALEVSEETVQEWTRSAAFRAQLSTHMEEAGTLQVPTAWGSVLQMGLEAKNPKVRLEALGMYLTRFDPGSAISDEEVKRRAARLAVEQHTRERKVIEQQNRGRS